MILVEENVEIYSLVRTSESIPRCNNQRTTETLSAMNATEKSSRSIALALISWRYKPVGWLVVSEGIVFVSAKPPSKRWNTCYSLVHCQRTYARCTTLCVTIWKASSKGTIYPTLQPSWKQLITDLLCDEFALVISTYGLKPKYIAVI